MLKIDFKILVLVFSISFCKAQNAKQEIININKAFYTNTSYAAVVDIKCFKDNEAKAIYSSRSTVYKFPGKYLYKNELSESMANKNYKINVDHKKKIMIVSKVTNKAPYEKHPDVSTFEQKEAQMQFDSILGNYKKVELKKVNEQTNSIYFEFKEGQYSKAIVEYNKANYRVSKMEFILKQHDAKTNVVNEYKYIISQNYLSEKQLSKDVFNETNYFAFKNKEVVGLNQYTGYEIVNYLNK